MTGQGSDDSAADQIAGSALHRTSTRGAKPSFLQRALYSTLQNDIIRHWLKINLGRIFGRFKRKKQEQQLCEFTHSRQRQPESSKATPVAPPHCMGQLLSITAYFDRLCLRSTHLHFIPLLSLVDPSNLYKYLLISKGLFPGNHRNYQ